MKKTTIVVMIVTVVAKIFGFARDKIIAHFFGVGVISDAFMLSFGVPSLILTVVAAALVTGFIPMYTRVRNEDEHNTEKFVNNVFNIMILFAFSLGVFMFLLPEVVVKITASGFDAETFALATGFVRVISMSVISVALIQLGTGYLNVNDSFIIPNLISIPSNVIIMSFTIIAYKTGNLGYLPYGALFGYAIQGLIIFLYMRKLGFRYKLVFDFKDPHLIKMVTLAGPLLLSTVILTFQDLFMMSFATVIHGKGGYSYISMSTRLMGFATGLFVSGILTVAYPMISHAAAKNDKKKVIDSMNDAILLISLFIIPASVGFITLSYEIVSFVYGSGQVKAEQLVVLGQVFKWAAVGLFFIALKDLFMRIHYAYQDVKTPLKAQILYTIVGVILFVVLGYAMGIKGLTLSMSISTTISGLYLFSSLLKKFKKLGMRTILSDFVKILFASLMMGVSIMGGKYFLVDKIPDNGLLLVLLFIAVFVYGALALILRVNVLLTLFEKKKISSS